MAEEVSSIGVKLTLNASSFMTGMTAATAKTEAFVAATKEAATVAGGAAGGGKTTSRASAAQNLGGVPIDLTVSPASIKKIREQIIQGIGSIPITITPQMSRQVSAEAQKVVAAQVTPVVGTRSGAAHVVATNVRQNLPKRAGGGPVYANQGYIVGEHRPEVFTPRTSGTIHPDASRYYREEEQRARRQRDEYLRHQDRMRRMAGGPTEPMGPLQRRIAGLPPLDTLPTRPAEPPPPPEPEWMRRARESKLPPKTYRSAGGYASGGRAKAMRPVACQSCGLVNWQEKASGNPREACFKCGSPMGMASKPKQAAAGAVEERLTTRQRQYTRNIRESARRMTDPNDPYGAAALKMGTEWYPEAQKWIAEQARHYEIPEPTARGVVASLSAGTAWSSNKTKAKRIFEAYAQGLPFPYQQTLDAHKKAFRILEGGEDPWDVLGHTPKVGQFFLNTGGDLDAITIDRWALRTGTRGAISQAGRGPVRTGVEKGFRKVAAEMDLAPVQLQAALWIQEKAETDAAAGRTPNLAKYMAKGGRVKPFCSTCGCNIRDAWSHQSTAKHQAALRGMNKSSSGWLNQQPGWAYGYRNQDSQYDPEGYEPNTEWWGKKAAKGAVVYDEAEFRKRVGPKALAEWAEDVDDPQRYSRNLASWIEHAPSWDASIKHLDKQAAANRAADRREAAEKARTGATPSNDNVRDLIQRAKAAGDPAAAATKAAHVPVAAPAAAMSEEVAEAVAGMPADLAAAVTEFESLIGEYKPAEDAFHRKSPGSDRRPVSHQKLKARTFKARDKVMRLKSQYGMSDPIKAYLHINGGGWRWAEAEDEAIAGKEYTGGPMSGYGRPQTPGLFTADEAPFRNLTQESKYARSFVTDQRFETAWQQMFGDIYGGMSHPGAPREGSNEAFSRYLKGGASPAGMPDESGAWREKYGHRPHAQAYGPFVAGSFGSFPSAAEALHGEMQKELRAKGLEQMEFPWAAFPKMEPDSADEASLPDSAFGTGRYRVAGPWPFDYLNELELKRPASTGHDPVWEQSIATAPASWKPTPEYDAKAAAAENRAKAAAAKAEAKAAARAATKAARVPQHEAPEVIAHEAVMAHHDEVKAQVVEEVVAEVAAAIPEPDTSGRIIGPSLYDLTPMPAAARPPVGRREAEQRLRGLGLGMRRGRGGDAGDGMYIVNELGPEAFIEHRDVGKLAARRPDIMSRIPGASDGARTGMIQKPAWSMFAPQKDGLIVRREDAHAALAATRAADGAVIRPEDLLTPGQEGRDAARLARLRTQAGYLAPQPGLVTPGFSPSGPLVAATQAGGGARSAEMEAFAAAMKADTAAMMAHAEAANKGSTLLAAGGEKVAGLLGPGPSVIPLGGPGEAMHGPAFSAGVDEKAAIKKLAASSAGATDEASSVFEKAGDEWVSIGKGLEAPARMAGALKAALESGAKKKDLLDLGPHSVRKAEGAAELGSPSGRDKDVTEAIRFGQVSGRQLRIRRGDPDDINERLDELRSRTAGSSISGTARTSRGEVAALAQLFGGGGMEFKRRQAELVGARSAFTRQGRVILGEEREVEDRTEALKYAKEHGKSEEAINTITQELTDHETTLAKARENMVPMMERLNKAELRVQPTTGGLLKSFGAIVLSTSAYGAAFSAVNMIIEKAAIPAVKRVADELLGWRPTMTAVTTALSDQTAAARGNVDATMAQAGATAALSGSALDWVQGLLQTTVVAKAGAKAQGETMELLRAAYGAQGRQEPQGLYGGYGGLFGSSLLGSEMGGGKGFSENIQGLFAGNRHRGPDYASDISKGVEFLGNSDVRNLVLDAAKEQGNPLGAAGDALGGLGDLTRSLGPLGLLVPGGIPAAIMGKTPSVNGGPGGYDPRAGLDQGQLEADKAGFNDLNEAAKRAGKATAGAATITYGYAKSKDEENAAVARAIAAGDVFGATMARTSHIVMSVNGEVAKTNEAYQAGLEQTAKGKTMVPEAVFVRDLTRQLTASRETRGIETQRQIDFEIPYDVFKGLLSNPLIAPGAAFGGRSPGQMGATGAAAGMTGSAMRSTTSSQANLATMAQQGLDAARAQISQYSPADLPDFNEAASAAQAASADIAGLTKNMMALNAAASRASWGNQIRLANRALGDALGMMGKIGGTRLGQLQREQWVISRASQQLNLQLQQRQITTQVALAGFQAPGETGEERYMRQKEKLAEADIAQRQLNFSFKEFTVSGSIWKENLQRAVQDARASLGVMQASRNAELYSIQAQQAVAARQQELAAHVGKMDAILNKARGNFGDVLGAAGSKVAEFGGSVSTATGEIMHALGFHKNRSGNWVGSGLPNPNQSLVPPDAHGGANGLLGMTIGETNFVAGEVKGEAVAILKNPRMGSFSPDSGGGGGTAVHVNINGPVVRNDQDISSLARSVADEVERRLARQGQMLGLRSPSY